MKKQPENNSGTMLFKLETTAAPCYVYSNNLCPDNVCKYLYSPALDDEPIKIEGYTFLKRTVVE